jgi:hypothetical protein
MTTARIMTGRRFIAGLTTQLGRSAALAALCMLASGCDVIERRLEPAAPSAVEAPADSQGLTAYLETMHSLGGADPARQADVFYEVEREYTRAPTTASTLNYAIALVTPDHPASKPAEGKKLLETLLATPERMTPPERTLALVVINEANARLKLEAENRRLLATLDDRSRSQANSNKRVQAQIEDNVRLRRALNEAQQKLDAIKEIERSIIERSPTPPGNRDATASETQSPPASR